MYLQEILEVAIGLVLMWLVLSIAAMTLQEWVETMLNGRAKDLERTIREMLSSRDLAKQLYAHPLIATLARPAKNPRKKGRLPAYIPSANFAAALFDIVTQAGTEASPVRTLTGEIDAHLAASLEDPAQLKLALDDWQTVLETGKQVAMAGTGQAAVDTLKLQIQTYGKKYPEIQPILDDALPTVYAFYKDFFDEERRLAPAAVEADMGMRQFRLGLKMMGNENPRLHETITAILRNAQVTAVRGDQAVAQARSQFETWFNNTMDRLSGSYKRKAQISSFIIGLVLALVMNVDSINLASSLWREPTLRQAIIAQAGRYTSANQIAVASTDPAGEVVSPLQTIPELQKQLQALNFPFGWTTNPVEYSETVTCDLSSPSAYDSLGNPSRLLGVHIGKVCVPVVNASPVNRDHFTGWLTKIFGLLITGAAAAQGAPFWFDILKKFINVRGTEVKPTEPTAVG